ncbi:MAG: hypothetical protein JSR44_11460 [Spirochaetes bacterium]|nr:hypothetical protein [Spirochaetota bacterium]
MKKSVPFAILPIIGFSVLFSAIGCRTTDRGSRMCEQSNTECHENCNEAMQDFNLSTNPSQRINTCDMNCERYFDNCMQRNADRQANENKIRP